MMICYRVIQNEKKKRNMNKAQKIGAWVMATWAVAIALMAVVVGYVNRPIEIAAEQSERVIMVPETVIVEVKPLQSKVATSKMFAPLLAEQVYTPNDFPDTKPAKGATYRAKEWRCEEGRDLKPAMGREAHRKPQAVRECDWR